MRVFYVVEYLECQFMLYPFQKEFDDNCSIFLCRDWVLNLRADPRRVLHFSVCGIFANFCKSMFFFSLFGASERA